MHYLEFLGEVHNAFEPELYVEIGIRAGGSMAVSRCRSYGIDPKFKIKHEIVADARLFRMTSDKFFARKDLDELFKHPADIAFIDGMHLFEYVLRDFVNIERVMSDKSGIIIFDDVLPRNAEEATRERHTTAWTGDVWKIRYCLAKYRPDLLLILIDTTPTGLMLVTGLNPNDNTLIEYYDRIVDEYNSGNFPTPPEEVMRRKGALTPERFLGSGSLEEIAEARDGAQIRKILDAKLPGWTAP